jgi:hypothetical protein
MMLEFYNQEYLPSLTKILTTLGSQCTCFTGTEIQPLTQKVLAALLAALLAADMLFVCLVDAMGRKWKDIPLLARTHGQVLSLLALLVQKDKY